MEESGIKTFFARISANLALLLGGAVVLASSQQQFYCRLTLSRPPRWRLHKPLDWHARSYRQTTDSRWPRSIHPTRHMLLAGIFVALVSRNMSLSADQVIVG
jgi:hypothetical protein